MFWVAQYHHREMQDKYLSLAADQHLGSIRFFLCVNQIVSGPYNYGLISGYSEQRENAWLPAHDSLLCHWSGVYIWGADRRTASTPTGCLTPLVHSAADVFKLDTEWSSNLDQVPCLYQRGKLWNIKMKRQSAGGKCRESGSLVEVLVLKQSLICFFGCVLKVDNIRFVLTCTIVTVNIS